MRMMVIFEKGFLVRHIGHLDLMRTMQRALRRSGLPVSYSKGFSPHIQMSFASPLGVGVTGRREMMDIPLETDIGEEDFAQQLNAALPDCLQVQKCRKIEDTFPSLMSLVAASRYTLQMRAGPEAEAIIKKLPDFMALSDYQTLRKTKSGENMCNIRPFVLTAQGDIKGDTAEIHCLLDNTPAGTLKPSLLMKSLRAFAGVGELPYVAIREEILCRLDGQLVSMEAYPYA